MANIPEPLKDTFRRFAEAATLANNGNMPKSLHIALNQTFPQRKEHPRHAHTGMTMSLIGGGSILPGKGKDLIYTNNGDIVAFKGKHWANDRSPSKPFSGTERVTFYAEIT